jgi:tRNA pseudouridine38-40 synthase
MKLILYFFFPKWNFSFTFAEKKEDSMVPNNIRYFMHLCFDGTRYNGWQVQPSADTVQESIENALTTLMRVQVNLTGAGRTDTGVHAKKYTAHFDCQVPLTKEDQQQLVYKLNKISPHDIAILEILEVNSDAHARFSALSRSYEYIITRKKDPFLIDKAWRMERTLDVAIMKNFCKILMEYENFESFSKVNTQVNNFRCRIMECNWKEEKNLLIFQIKADRFLRNMVRSIVGTMVEGGLGKINEQQFRQIIESRNRSKAGYSVPGSGLYFMGAEYPADIYPGRDIQGI